MFVYIFIHTYIYIYIYIHISSLLMSARQKISKCNLHIYIHTYIYIYTYMYYYQIRTTNETDDYVIVERHKSTKCQPTTSFRHMTWISHAHIAYRTQVNQVPTYEDEPCSTHERRPYRTPGWGNMMGQYDGAYDIFQTYDMQMTCTHSISHT